MLPQPAQRFLTMNTGSSSVRAASYELSEDDALVLATGLERIDAEWSRMYCMDTLDAVLLGQHHDPADHDGEPLSCHDSVSQILCHPHTWCIMARARVSTDQRRS